MTFDSDWQQSKQDWQSFFTEEGMQIDESDAHSPNTCGSIHDSAEPDSNMTSESDLQRKKQ
jgi:hypothetical protein